VTDAPVLTETRRSAPTMSGPADRLLASADHDVVVLGASKDPNPKVTMAVLERASAMPRFVVKAPMTDAAAVAVERETTLLEELRGSFGELPCLPEVLGRLDFRGRSAAVVSGLPGTPMFTRYHRRRHTTRPAEVAADFRAVEAWLATFQSLTHGTRAPVSITRGVEQLLERRFRGDDLLGPSVEALAGLSARLDRSEITLTAVHGDLWCGNILIEGHAVSGVVDWELGAVRGDPLRDLVRFAITYALYLDRHTKRGRDVTGHPGLRAGAWGAGVRYAVEGRGWFSELFRDFIQSGTARLGVPEIDWRDAVLAGLVEVAVTADEHDFARRHLELFLDLERGKRP
jgi:aminoglycoside phosphotransferase